MLRNIYHTPSFNGARQETHLAARPGQRTGSTWPFATTLLSIPDALRGGLTASRQYEHLTSEGISHDTAVRKALGIASRQCEVRTHR
jgi:hypothetical protein